MRYVLLALVAFIIIAASLSGRTFITKTNVDNVLPQLVKKGEPFAIFADMEKLVVDFSTGEQRPVVARPATPKRSTTIVTNSTPAPKIATPTPHSVTSYAPSTPPPIVLPVLPVLPVVTPIVPPVVPIIVTSPPPTIPIVPVAPPPVVTPAPVVPPTSPPVPVVPPPVVTSPIDPPPIVPVPPSASSMYVDVRLTSQCLGNYSISKRDCTGTDGDALRTPKGISDMTLPGATVYFRGGTYDSASMAYYPSGGTTYARLLEIKTSGAPSAPITYKNYNNEEVIFKGYGVEGQDLDKDGDGYADGPSGKGSREELVRVSADYINLSGLAIINSVSKGIVILGNHNTVENCLIKNNWMVGLYVTGSNNTIRNNEGYGQRHGNAMTLSAPQAGSGALIGMSNNNVFKNNLLYDNGYDPATKLPVLPIGGDPAGGGNSDGAGASKVCADNAAAFGVANACLSNQWIDNVMYHNADDGLDISTADTIVQGNINFDNGPRGQRGFKILRSVPGTNRYFENIALENDGLGFELRTSETLKAYHNLAIRNPGQGLTGATEFKNNVEAFNGNNTPADGDVGTNDPAKVMFVNNDFSVASVNVNIPTSLTIPQRVDFIRNQFKAALSLKVGSPLIDKGELIAGYHCARADDDSSNPYPAGDGICRHWAGVAPDMGAFEYGL